jgi:E3 SUMO-protein ligase NSE2
VSRYAENNDYIGFKRIIHDAQHPGDNAPPVPPASSWFPDEATSGNPSAARRRRLATQADNTENGDDDDDDDDIQMTAVVSSLKCPLTLQTFKEPYSNRICKHTFEKSAILQFHRENGVAFADPSHGGRRGRGVPAGPKQLRCPERGCDAVSQKTFQDTKILT